MNYSYIFNPLQAKFDRKYSAAVPRTFVNATAGGLVEQLGWGNFFLLCSALAIPGMLLLLKLLCRVTR